MRLDDGLSQSLVYDFYLLYCVEGMCGYLEVIDEFDEVDDLNPYVPKEIIYGTYTNYHYCFWI